MTDDRTSEQIALWGQALTEAYKLHKANRTPQHTAAALLQARADQAARDMVLALRHHELAIELERDDLLAAIPPELRGKP